MSDYNSNMEVYCLEAGEVRAPQTRKVDKASGALARTRSRAEFLATSKRPLQQSRTRDDGNAKAVELAFTLIVGRK